MEKINEMKCFVFGNINKTYKPLARQKNKKGRHKLPTSRMKQRILLQTLQTLYHIIDRIEKKNKNIIDSKGKLHHYSSIVNE